MTSPDDMPTTDDQFEVSHDDWPDEIAIDDVEIIEPSHDTDAESETASADQDSPRSWEQVSTALLPSTTLDRYLAEVRRYPFLTKDEELRLFYEYQVKGREDAAVKLILANLRISVSIAKEYGSAGMDQMDLIQEGNVGLLQAIKKFDPTKNVRFYAYAAWWVRAYVLRHLLNNFRLVKIGTTQEQRKLFFNLKKEKAKLEQQGFVPDPKLIADRLQVRERDVIEMDQRLGSWELSLDQSISEDGESTFYDVFPANDIPIDEQVGRTQLRTLFRKKLAEFAKQLTEREEDILRNRLLSDTPLTLEELGRKYSITKERARQVEAKIIKRLQAFIQSELKDFEHISP